MTTEHNHGERYMDSWLKWVAILGPFLGFLFGVGSGTMIAYQAYQRDHSDIGILFNWKDKQDTFNQQTVAAIARLKALIRDSQP
jgi:hypothetical protein